MKKQITLSILFSLLVFISANSQTIDYNKFIKETQNTISESGDITMAWWIPIEFWEVTFDRDKSMTELQSKEIINALKPYVIYAVVDGKLGPLGGIKYISGDSIGRTIKLEDTEGIEYKPLETEMINSDVQNLLSVFKPILKNMMGQLGENMNFFVFNDVKADMSRVIDPYISGNVKLSFSDNIFNWKTPLGSLLPLKKCPVDNELLDGSWKYCPWHGKKLVEQE